MPVYPRHLVNNTGRAFYADPFAGQDPSAWNWAASMALLESFASTRYASGYARSVAGIAQELLRENPDIQRGELSDWELVATYAPKRLAELQQGNRQFINEFNESFAQETGRKFQEGGMISDIGIFLAQMGGFMADPVNFALSFTPAAPIRYARNISRTTKAGTMAGRPVTAVTETSTRQGFGDIMRLAGRQGTTDAAVLSPLVGMAALADYETHRQMGADVGEAAEIAAYRLIDIPATFAFRAGFSVAFDYARGATRTRYLIGGQELDEPSFNAFVKHMEKEKAEGDFLKVVIDEHDEIMRAQAKAKTDEWLYRGRVERMKGIPGRTQANINNKIKEFFEEIKQEKKAALAVARWQESVDKLSWNVREGRAIRSLGLSDDPKSVSPFQRAQAQTYRTTLEKMERTMQLQRAKRDGVITEAQQKELQVIEDQSQAELQKQRNLDRNDQEWWKEQQTDKITRETKQTKQGTTQHVSLPERIRNANRQEKEIREQARTGAAKKAKEKGLPVLKADLDTGDLPLKSGRTRNKTYDEWRSERAEKNEATAQGAKEQAQGEPPKRKNILERKELKAKAAKLSKKLTLEKLMSIAEKQMKHEKSGNHSIKPEEVDQFLQTYKPSDRAEIKEAVFKPIGDNGNYTLTSKFKWIGPGEITCNFKSK